MNTKYQKWSMRVILMIVASLFALNIRANIDGNPDFGVDGVYYKINKDQKSVSVTFKGTVVYLETSHNCYSGDVIIPETVEYDGKTYTVTTIDDGAFWLCNVFSVSLPSTITTIKVGAFRGCKYLTELVLPNSLKTIEEYAFANSGLTSMKIPDGVEELPNGLFRYARSLESVSLPFGLKKMGEYVFSETLITKIQIPNEVEEIPNGAFQNSKLEEVGLSWNIKRIGDWAFADTPLKYIQLPPTVESIGASAFRNCGLVNINMPSAITELGEYAFYNCKSLDNVVMDETQIKTIEVGTFIDCTALTSVYLPNTLESIGENAFRRDAAMLTIDVPVAVTTIGVNAFQDCKNLIVNLLGPVSSIGENAFYTIKELHITDHDSWVRCAATNRLFGEGPNLWPHVYESNGDVVSDYKIPEGIESLMRYHFSNNPDIKTLTLPQSMKTIGDLSFQDCKNLETLDLGGVEEIGRFCFTGNSSLKTVKFGKSIKKVGYDAFYGCKKIETVDIADLANWCGVEFVWQYEGPYIYEPYTEANPLYVTRKIVVKGKQLDELNIPNGVTTINDYVFASCLYFDKVTIPNSVTTIGYSAFANCSHLEKLVISDLSSIESIGSYAFMDCAFTKLTLPNTITKIGSNTFLGCSQLKSVNIPSDLTEIAEGLFSGCSSLESIDIHNGIKTIGANAFNGCNSEKFTSIAFPPSIDYVGRNAFENCNQLKEIHITDLAAWCSIYFEQGLSPSNPLYYAEKLYVNDEPIVDLVVPEGITKVNVGAFMGYKGLTSITIPEGIVSIEGNAFQYCSNVSKISLPASLTNVGGGAFYGTLSQTDNELHIKDLATWAKNGLGSGFNSSAINAYLYGELIKDLIIPDVDIISGSAFSGWNIETATLPKSLETASHYTFSSCKKLKTIYSKAKFAPILKKGSEEENYFEGHKYRNEWTSSNVLDAIYVPKGKGNTYKNSWSGHTDIIKEADPEMTGEQNAESIAEMKAACQAVMDAAYLDLTGATLDESVTEETLKAGDGDRNMLYYLPAGTNITGDNIIVDGAASSISLNGSQPIGVPMEFTASTVKFACDMKADESHALCLPFDYTLPESMKAYSLKTKNGNGDLVFMETESFKANTPYVVVPSEDITTLNATNVLMKEMPEEMTDAGISGFEFRGSLLGVSQYDAVNDGIYVLGKDKKWTPVGDDKSTGVAPCSAYLIPTSDYAKAEIECFFHSADDPIPAGDANEDYSVDVCDIVSIINCILGNPSANFNYLAADINNDGEVDVFDAMMAVDLALTDKAAARSMVRAANSPVELATITTTADGIVLDINDASRFTAFQFDVEVADGVELTEARLTTNTGHVLQFVKNGGNTYRVIGISMSNSTFSAGRNGLVELSFSKNDRVQINNIVFVTPQETKVYFACDNAIVTGISSIENEQAEDIFDLTGRRMDTDRSHLPMGVYIINNKKVVIK